MARKPKTPQAAEIAPGGAGSALDGTDARDQALIRQCITRWPKRWKTIDDQKKAKWAKQIELAGDAAASLLKSKDPHVRLAAINGINSAVRTGVMMEAQNQRDEHLVFDKMGVLNPEDDGGDGTPGQPLVVLNVIIGTPPAPASPGSQHGSRDIIDQPQTSTDDPSKRLPASEAR